LVESYAFVTENPATPEKINILLREGGIADYKGGGDESNSNTPLFWTVCRQDLKAAELLLENNADPNQLDHAGDPFSCWCCSSEVRELEGK
jgi:ankyrin repeat protein